jgi:hypothetical protein
MNDVVEDARLEQALRLLMHGVPGREVIGHHAPGDAAADDVAQRVEDLPQGMLALGCVFAHERQIRRDKARGRPTPHR